MNFKHIHQVAIELAKGLLDKKTSKSVKSSPTYSCPASPKDAPCAKVDAQRAIGASHIAP